MAIAYSLQWLLPIALIFLVALLKKKSRNRKKINLPPSPRKLPIIGNLHQVDNLPHLSLRSLAYKHGPIFYLQLGEIPTVVISSAKLAKELVRSHDLSILSRPLLFSAKYLLYNCTDLGFAPYGPYWRGIRKICTLELLSAKRVQSFRFVHEQEVARLIDRITGCYPGKVNLSKFIGLYANGVVSRMSLGKDFYSGGDYDRHDFKSMLEEFQQVLGGFSIGEFFPSVPFLYSLSGMKSRVQRAALRFDQFFDEVIDEHLISNGEKEHKDLVDVLLDIHKAGSIDDISLTMANVKAIIMDMFAAGTDTTFITLDWAMTELLMNPECKKKAKAEVRSIMGDRRVVQDNDLPYLHYMKAVIKETLRMHPPAPVLMPRETINDIKIGPYDIPAKTRIYINAWAIGRDPISWKNPETFEPDRFLGSSIDFRGQDFEFIPFGVGRRICPGVTLGIANVEVALAQLLLSFDWEFPNGISANDLDMAEVFGITMHRLENLIVVAKPYP